MIYSDTQTEFISEADEVYALSTADKNGNEAMLAAYYTDEENMPDKETEIIIAMKEEIVMKTINCKELPLKVFGIPFFLRRSSFLKDCRTNFAGCLL